MSSAQRNGLTALILVLLFVGVVSAVARNNDTEDETAAPISTIDSNTTAPLGLPPTTVAGAPTTLPATTVPATTADTTATTTASAGTTVTTTASGGTTATTTAPGSGLATGGSGQVGGDEIANTGGVSELVPGLGLLALGLAGIARRRRLAA